MTGSSTTQADAAIVIAKSDIIILSVSTLALLIGVARWQMGTRYVETITIPASARVTQPVPLNAATNTSGPDTTVQITTGAPSVVGTAQPSVQPLGSTDTADTQNRLPTTPGAGIDATTSVASVAEPVYGIHRVRSGQSLSKLAVQYGTTVQTLQQLNGIADTTIFIGQELRYPLPSP